MKIPYEDEVQTEVDYIMANRLPAVAEDDDVSQLSTADQTVFLIAYFDSQVLNGGLIQWLGNPTGAFTYETLAALERIGASVSAGLIRAVHAMFSPGRISRDYDERNKQLDMLDGADRARIDELSDIYGGEGGREGDEIFEKLFKFMEAHRRSGS